MEFIHAIDIECCVFVCTEDAEIKPKFLLNAKGIVILPVSKFENKNKFTSISLNIIKLQI